MPLFHAVCRHFVRILVAASLVLATLPVLAQQAYTVAVVGDGRSDRLARQQQLYVDELLALDLEWLSD